MSDADANPTRRVIPRPAFLETLALRADASMLVLTFAGVCAVTIAGTRAYLAATGYPQIGGEVYHIAHALWGGLFLTLAVIVLITLTNSWAPLTGAILGGVGAGLFVDEVGKFITQANDYFFPLAATIVYLFLVSLAAATIGLSRVGHTTPSAHLHVALDLIEKSLDKRLNSTERRAVRAHLDAAEALSPSPTHSALIASLRSAVVPDPSDEGEADISWVDRLAHHFGAQVWRRVTRTFLLVQALLGLSALGLFVASQVTDLTEVPDFIASANRGGIEGMMSTIYLLTTVVASVLALIAIWFMSPRRLNAQKASTLAVSAVALSLLVANSLGAYSSQFTILFDAAFQLATLGTLELWRRARAHL